MTTSRQIDDIPKEKNRIKIAIVEDHTLLRESLIKSLNEAFDIQVVFDASNGVEFFELLKKKKISLKGTADLINISGGDARKLLSQRVEVELGVRRGSEVQVVKGLALDDTVVVAGQQRLQRDGTAVRVLDMSRPAPGAPAAPAAPARTGG